MVCCWLCCPSSSRRQPDKAEHLLADPSTADEDQDFEHLQSLATKRDIKVTIKKGTQAGIVAGLSVMAGVIVAGPVGAVAGGAFGTAVAAHMAKDVVTLNQLLEQTPTHKRHEILQLFRESFREEFTETIQSSPELKLLIGGTTILGIMRYAVDRQLLKNEQLEKVDGILRKVY
mmetsp:Transcript_18693/g.35529  ORF Transcript_18693/g.35529 Transcript_18693/m.35529 type:complete len:174 (-) Transcript_18693:173-694(-)